MAPTRRRLHLPALNTLFRRKRKASGDNDVLRSPSTSQAGIPEAVPALISASTAGTSSTSSSAPSPDKDGTPRPLRSHNTLTPEGWTRTTIKWGYTDYSIFGQCLEDIFGKDNYNFKTRSGSYIIHSARPFTKEERRAFDKAIYQHYTKQYATDDEGGESE